MKASELEVGMAHGSWTIARLADIPGYAGVKAHLTRRDCAHELIMAGGLLAQYMTRGTHPKCPSCIEEAREPDAALSTPKQRDPALTVVTDLPIWPMYLAWLDESLTTGIEFAFNNIEDFSVHIGRLGGLVDGAVLSRIDKKQGYLPGNIRVTHPQKEN